MHVLALAARRALWSSGDRHAWVQGPRVIGLRRASSWPCGSLCCSQVGPYDEDELLEATIRSRHAISPVRLSATITAAPWFTCPQ